LIFTARRHYYYYYYYYLDSGAQFPGNEKKYAMQNKKYKSQAGMNLTAPLSSQNCHVWHCATESKRTVAEIKS